MSNHPCGLCGGLHFNTPCKGKGGEFVRVAGRTKEIASELRVGNQTESGTVTTTHCSNCNGNKSLCRCEAHNHDNYAIVVCDPKRGNTARDCEGFTRATNEAHEVMRGFHDEVVVKLHHDPLGQLKSFAFYYNKGVLVAVIAPSKKVG